MQVNASIAKVDVVKFDKIGKFELWQRRLKDLLVQQGLVKVLYGNTKKLEKMIYDEWEELEMKAMSMGAREYASAKWTVVEKNRVTTQIKSRNCVRNFGLIIYMHGYAYQIMGSKFGYGLGRCQAHKIAWLIGRPPLCVARPYLIKKFIKRALIP